MVHNLICGALTCVGGGTGSRYTPYHMPHQTEVMGFMTFLHGDDRFMNNIFVQKWPKEDVTIPSDSDASKAFSENREAGTHVMDPYPTYDEWIAQFDMENETPNMAGLAPAHNSKLPVWCDGNAYFCGAGNWKNEKRFLRVDTPVSVDLAEQDGKYTLMTDLYEHLGGFHCGLITSDVLGKAFEPEQRFENTDGSEIVFNSDYFGDHRGLSILPGPFAAAPGEKTMWG